MEKGNAQLALVLTSLLFPIRLSNLFSLQVGIQPEHDGRKALEDLHRARKFTNEARRELSDQ